MSRIANYSTVVSAMKSIGEIQGMLVAHGAQSILVNYVNQEPTGLAFIITTKHGDVPFRLPANIDAMKRVLERQRVRSTITRERAARVAWRVLRDWVRAQLAMLETEMVTMEQVMLPYMCVPNSDRTLYEAMQERHFLLTEGTK